ncbi:hypothetical protein [Alicyclobacillus macrosporangiidus]|uniref:Uncharacterized protein n=1 Tax=Alicyclobacillus macrosporangiidus TaxID=392015 RepID=A0A1I7KCE4_9BACL|nr:hypothetical protein [Alicyclobacillus macrosporangiidus]SFU95040.1 hypothetical protein SAMN05421543_11522 [Alicyclobacillus macrosporangiidus]
MTQGTALPQTCDRTCREGGKLIFLSDLFAEHVKTRTDWKIDHPPHDVDARCSFCTRRVRQAYARSDILLTTFTDHDYFPVMSPWLCESCALMFTFGLQNAPNAWSFLAYGTKGEDFTSFFPWDTYELPWYRIPRIRPLLAVAVEGSYKQKHTIFRGKVCYDPNWIIVWRSKPMYAPADIAERVAALENDWRINGYPKPKEIRSTLDPILEPLEEALRDWTRAIIMTHRKKEMESHAE